MPDGQSPLPAYVVQIEFMLANAPANAITPMQLSTPDNKEMLMKKGGWFLGFMLETKEQQTAGTARGRFRLNGKTVGTNFQDAQGILNDVDRVDTSAFQPLGIDPFQAGDSVGLAVQTAGWAPTKADFKGVLFVAVQP